LLPRKRSPGLAGMLFLLPELFFYFTNKIRREKKKIKKTGEDASLDPRVRDQMLSIGLK